MKNKGFTLIELMVGVALVGFVSLAAYTFYINTFQFQVMQERQKDMKISLLFAMDMLTSDIKAAGFGVMDPRDRGDNRRGSGCPGALRGATVTGVLDCAPLALRKNIAFTPADNATSTGIIATSTGIIATSTDTVILTTRDQFVGTLLSPTNSAVAANRITLAKASVVPLVNGTLITVGGLFSANVAAVSSVGVITLDPTPKSLLKPRDTYPAGLDVYTVATITYSIRPNGGGLALFRTVGLAAPTLLADNIEDLQMKYYLTGATVGTDRITPVPAVDFPNNRAAFTAVRVSLIARTLDVEPGYLGGFRPALENHAAGGADNFRRAVLTRVVEVPNSGCRANYFTC